MKKIYVADFGAGNTCLYCANPYVNIREATPLNTLGGEPSGYAIDKKGKVLLGMGLSQLGYRQLQQIDSFHINIKAQPTEDNKEELVHYFRSWLEKMKEDHSQEFKGVDEPYWFIGCPTGEDWKKKENIELYKSIFEEAGYENVYIVPESNAALAFYQQTQRIMDVYNKKTQLLLIDQGAYSLDATNYAEGNVTSYGGYLGASLIERMMVHTILYTDEEKIRMRKRIVNWPPTLEAARSLYEQEGVRGKFYTYLLLQARFLKEEYFKQINNKTLLETADLSRNLDYEVEGEQLVLFTNSVMMSDILEKKSIKQALGSEFNTLAPEVQKEIGDKTWMEAFEIFLDNVDAHYPNLKQSNNVIVMLTGGGSLMKCVSDAVKKHYASASVYCDPEAISAIGKGMAFWAPDKIAALDFEHAFNVFTEREEIDEDGDTVNCINNKLFKAFTECVVQLAKEIIAEESNAVKYGIEEWRDYKCNNTAIPGKIEQRLKNWCKNTGMPSFIKDIDNHIAGLKTELNSEFNKTIASFQLDKFELLTKNDDVFLSDCKQALPIIFDKIVEFIVDHYKENEIWDSFLNEKKHLFSNPRIDFYNAITESLNEWIDREIESTIEVCKVVFFEMKNEITDDLTCTFQQLFQIEGRIDLLNLMKKHIKEILGKLVLEEYIEGE